MTTVCLTLVYTHNLGSTPSCWAELRLVKVYSYATALKLQWRGELRGQTTMGGIHLTFYFKGSHLQHTTI